ncbi:MAG: hypothetical protein ABSA67_07715 [Candidatus Brocadiia bacterium]|jgi:hypothetical protein
MRTAALGLVFAGIATLFTGCASHRDQRGATAESAPELVSRFDAASAISDFATRDQALAEVAWLGAQADDSRMVLNCLGAMRDSPVRDQAAYQCSGRLAEDGWVPQAVAVAQTIGDSTVRDRALSKIAQSSPYPIAPP